MKTFTHRSPQSGHCFSKLGRFFPIWKKGHGIPSPSPSNYGPRSALDRVMRLKSFQFVLKEVLIFKFLESWIELL